MIQTCSNRIKKLDGLEVCRLLATENLRTLIPANPQVENGYKWSL